MSVPCKFERSLLSHEEYETIHLTHHPAIYDVEAGELEAMRPRLRKMHDKERALSRQKRREGRGKAEARGASFPGTVEHASQRKQVFAAALKRVNKELSVFTTWQLGPLMSKQLERLSRCIEQRTSRLIPRRS